METPDILLDAAEDGCCEERGWVEATVSKEQACELIWPHAEMASEPDAIPPDPERVVKVTLAPLRDPASCDWEEQRWHPVADLPGIPEVEGLEDRLAEAREYWEIPVV